MSRAVALVRSIADVIEFSANLFPRHPLALAALEADITLMRNIAGLIEEKGDTDAAIDEAIAAAENWKNDSAPRREETVQ